MTHTYRRRVTYYTTLRHTSPMSDIERIEPLRSSQHHDSFVARVEVSDKMCIEKLIAELDEDEKHIKQLFLDAEAVELIKEMGRLSTNTDDLDVEYEENAHSDDEEETEPIERHFVTLKPSIVWRIRSDDILDTLNLRTSGSSRELKMRLEGIELQKMLCRERLKQLEEHEALVKVAEEVARHEEGKELEELRKKWKSAYARADDMPKLISDSATRSELLFNLRTMPDPMCPFKLIIDVVTRDGLSSSSNSVSYYFASIEKAHEYLRERFGLTPSRTIPLGVREIMPSSSTCTYNIVTLVRM